MSEAGCPLQNRGAFQFDRGKNCGKKNFAFWFGIAQMQKRDNQMNEIETNLRKTGWKTSKNCLIEGKKIHKLMINARGHKICCG